VEEFVRATLEGVEEGAVEEVEVDAIMLLLVPATDEDEAMVAAEVETDEAADVVLEGTVSQNVSHGNSWDTNTAVACALVGVLPAATVTVVLTVTVVS
jgi:hypothetical protein